MGEWGGDGSVGRSGDRRALPVGSINGAVWVVGVGCAVAWVARDYFGAAVEAQAQAHASSSSSMS